MSRPSERERALVSCASVILADFLLGGLVDLSQKDISEISGNSATVIDDFARYFQV